MTTTLRSWVLFGLIWVCVTHGPAIGQEAPVREPNADGLAVSEKARDIHFSGMLFDGHNDLPWTLRAKAGSSFDSADIRQPQPQFHTDIPRLQAGGVKAQFWSVYVPVSTRLEASSLLTTLEQIDLVHEMCRRYPDVFEVALTADDVERIVAEGKIASLMGVEGGHSIENSLENLRRLFDRGARYMTLTHSRNVEWADSATDEPQHQGLTEFGREVVREMNRLGMLVDLSHVSPKTMHDTLDETKAPVIFSHSSARAICDHPRNVPDDVLLRLPDNGGVVMVNFMSGYIVPTEQLAADRQAHGTFRDVVDHIEHVIRVAGIDHVGIGSDYDGVSRLPIGLEDVSCYPRLTEELLRRGYERDHIHQVLGGNVLRVMKIAERVADELREAQQHVQEFGR